MSDDIRLYDDVAALERYLNVPDGSLKNIPIYARKAAVDAILKVREMEKTSLFRPGLYYIVLADLCANTAFNTKYGDAEGDVRTEWFHTAAIQSIGEIEVRNYIAFSKTIGDAALLIFSSFLDVYEWSERFSENLKAMTQEYPEISKFEALNVRMMRSSNVSMIFSFEPGDWFTWEKCLTKRIPIRCHWP